MKMRGPRDHEARATCVYVIKRSSEEIKIGISNKPKRRLSQLAISTPDKLTLAHTVKPETISALYVEKAVKHMLAAVRTKGEWFACSPALGIMAINTAIDGSMDARACIAGYIEMCALETEWTRCCQQIESRRRDDEYERKVEAKDEAYRAMRLKEDALHARYPDQMAILDPWGVPAITISDARNLPLDAPKGTRVNLHVTIYPEEWNKARLAAQRAKRAGVAQ